MRRGKKEKVFGPGRQIPLDRNVKARVEVYARAWSKRHQLPGQHKGPITRTFMDVLKALLWGFHNCRTGACFPSYEAIAEKAECARSTVAEAIKALEFAGVLTWQHRIVRVRTLAHDLFGRATWVWRVLRRSNAYVLIDPSSSESENRTGTQNQDSYHTRCTPPIDPMSHVGRALASLGAAIRQKEAHEMTTIPPP